MLKSTSAICCKLPVRVLRVELRARDKRELATYVCRCLFSKLGHQRYQKTICPVCLSALAAPGERQERACEMLRISRSALKYNTYERQESLQHIADFHFQG